MLLLSPSVFAHPPIGIGVTTRLIYGDDYTGPYIPASISTMYMGENGDNTPFNISAGNQFAVYSAFEIDKSLFSNIVTDSAVFYVWAEPQTAGDFVRLGFLFSGAPEHWWERYHIKITLFDVVYADEIVCDQTGLMFDFPVCLINSGLWQEGIRGEITRIVPEPGSMTTILGGFFISLGGFILRKRD